MKFLKKLHWFEITLILIVMGVHAYAAFSAPHNFPSRWFTRDDAYYYFKVAQNISEGHGSSFDGINLTNGYHPLWMLVCIPIFSLARFDLILPLRIMLMVMAALSCATSILLFRFLKKPAGQTIAMLAAAFWALSLEVHSIITQQGMETGIVAFSVMLFLYLIQKTEAKDQLETRDLVILALTALFVLFSRLDGIYLILIAGVWVIFRKTPIRYFLPADLALTFFVIVAAFIQRATLKVYLLVFDDSAILMAAITFIIQTIVFYFSGLYVRPASLPRLRIVVMTIVGVTISAFLSTSVMMILSTFMKVEMPRAVPVLYWAGMIILTLFTRLVVRAISPWPVRLVKGVKPFQGFLAGKSHIRVALEPLPNWFRQGSIYFGILAAGLIGYMGLNQLLFGTPMPVSGQIKRWWGSLPNDVYGGGAKTVLDIFGLDPEYSQSWNLFTNPFYELADRLSALGWNFDGWFWLLITFVIFCVLLLFLLDREKTLKRLSMVLFVPLVISAELHTFIYGAMAYAAKHEWYWVMQMLSVVIFLALGLAALRDRLPHRKQSRLVLNSAIGAVCVILTFSFGNELINRMPYNDPLSGEPYMDTLPILEGFTEPGSLIGMTGGGNTGYFITGRTIVNMDGLINSYPYFDALQNNQGGKYLANIGLDYIFANRYIITSSMPYRYQFTPQELLNVDRAPVYGQKELMKYLPAK